MAVQIKFEDLLEGILIFSTEHKHKRSSRIGNKGMNIIDLRDTFIETPTGKKIKDRRKNPYPYGTQEWRNYIIKNGFEFPPSDRRDNNRRNTDNSAPVASQGDKPEKPYVRILLTPAEKKLLEDLYLSELD